MDRAGAGRVRSVRLTATAIVEFERRVQQKWASSGDGGKLTLRRKSELLGLSEKTLTRLQKGERIDRNSAIMAFLAVDLVWEEDYAVRENGAEPVVSVPRIEAEPATRARPWRKILPALVGAGVMVAFVLAANRASPKLVDQAQGVLHAGIRAYHAADFGAAERCFQSSFQKARALGDIGTMSESTRMLADVRLAQGSPLAALKLYQEALSLRKSTGAVSAYPPLYHAIGVTQLKLKNFEEVKKQLLLAVDGYVREEDFGGMASAQKDLGCLSVALGDDTSALAWFASARSGEVTRLNPGLYMDVRSQEAMVLSRQGNHVRAREILTECRDYWRKQNHERWIAAMDLKLAKVEMADGNRDRARDLLLASSAGYRAVGDGSGETEASDLLKQL